jgi:ATP-dependent DNA ligase
MEWRGIQLAKDFEPEKATFPMFAEPKLDGYRMIARITKEGVVTFHCRDEKPVDWPRKNLLHIEKALVAAGFRDCYVDGEIMAADWGKTAIVKSAKTSQEDAEGLKFHIFDYVNPDLVDAPFELRRLALKQFNLWAPGPSSPIVRVACTLVDSLQAAQAIDKVHREAGYEGTMLKDPHATYEFKRSRAWMKLKPFKTIEGRVVGIVEGKGKHKGRMGALECELKDGTRFNVGTGFTDENRASIWELTRTPSRTGVRHIIGEIVEVLVQDSDVGTVRHPSFVRFRPDRTSL